MVTSPEPLPTLTIFLLQDCLDLPSQDWQESYAKLTKTLEDQGYQLCLVLAQPKDPDAKAWGQGFKQTLGTNGQVMVGPASRQDSPNHLKNHSAPSRTQTSTGPAALVSHWRYITPQLIAALLAAADCTPLTRRANHPPLPGPLALADNQGTVTAYYETAKGPTWRAFWLQTWGGLNMPGTPSVVIAPIGDMEAGLNPCHAQPQLIWESLIRFLILSGHHITWQQIASIAPNTSNAPAPTTTTTTTTTTTLATPLAVIWQRLVMTAKFLGKPTQFWGFGSLLVLASYLITVLLTYDSYGVSFDETPQDMIGTMILAWYRSGFQDQSLFTAWNLKYYGGFFEIIIVTLSDAFGVENRYLFRHLLTPLFAMLGILYAGRLAFLIAASWRAGFLAMLFLILNPIFYGHAFINSKDIPFATAYIISTFYFLKFAQARLQGQALVVAAAKLGLAIGMAIGIRVGGLLFFGFIAAFLGIQWLSIAYQRRHIPWATIWTDTKASIIIGLGTIAVTLPAWPYVALDPLHHFVRSLRLMNTFPHCQILPFAGSTLPSCQLATWQYLPHMFVIQIPEAILLGLLIGIGGWWHGRSQKPRSISLVTLTAVTALLPLAWMLVSGTKLYGNTRQILFIGAIFTVAAAWGWDYGLAQLKTKHSLRSAYLVLGLLSAVTLIKMKNLFPYEYTYYNLLAGGMTQAYADWPRDYWGTGTLEVLRILEGRLAAADQTQPYYGPPRRRQVFCDCDQKGVKAFFRNSPYLEIVEGHLPYEYKVASARGALTQSAGADGFIQIKRYDQIIAYAEQPTFVANSLIGPRYAEGLGF